MELEVLDGLLFVSGDEGITKKNIEKILEISEDEVNSLIEKLKKETLNRGVCIKEYGEKIKYVTKEKHFEYYKKFFNNDDGGFLSPSALETLAIIAYNEPVTRVMIDEIRGVSSAHIVRKLVFRNLIEEKGRSELPGRPILYGVTDGFLDYFGLSSLEELPKIKIEEKEEVELFSSKYTEEI